MSPAGSLVTMCRAPPRVLRPDRLPLGAARDLDPFNIHEVHVCAHVAAQVHPVKVDAHGRIRSDDVILHPGARA